MLAVRLHVQLDRDVARSAVLLDQHVVIRLFDDVFDLVEHVAFDDNKTGGVVPNVCVLRQRQMHPLRAAGVGALAEELVHVLVVAVARSKVVDLLVDLPKEILIPRKTCLLSVFHSARS